MRHGETVFYYGLSYVVGLIDSILKRMVPIRNTLRNRSVPKV